MPLPYVKKLADKKNIPLKKAEEKWKKASKITKKQTGEMNYAYAMSIFKNMMGLKKNEKFEGATFDSYFNDTLKD